MAEPTRFARIYAAQATLLLAGAALVQLIATSAAFLEQASVVFMFTMQLAALFSGYNVLVSTMTPAGAVVADCSFLRWAVQAQYNAVFRHNADYDADDMACEQSNTCETDILHHYRYAHPAYGGSMACLLLIYALVALAQLPLLYHRQWQRVLA